MAGGAEDDSSGGRGALFAFVFSMFVTVLTFTVLVLLGAMLVFFVLTAMLMFFPLVFTAAAAAVMFGPLLCLLTISFRLLLKNKKSYQVNI